MKYTIVLNKESGEIVSLAHNLSLRSASMRARTWAKTMRGITVEFFRAADGQHGYLNADGNHSPVGTYWE